MNYIGFANIVYLSGEKHSSNVFITGFVRKDIFSSEYLWNIAFLNYLLKKTNHGGWKTPLLEGGPSYIEYGTL